MLRALIVLILLFAGLPLMMVGCLRQLPPPVTSFMLQSELKPVEYQWVPAGQIAEVARKAVVASEDQKFWSHEGFDLEAMEKAHRDNQKRLRKRGASTISQQTAKNLFLWPGGGYLRKGIEAYFTVLIELLWPKARILEIYLNIAEFGPGIYGVEAAAQRFFGKSAARLTPTEAARLAAVLPNPSRWNAERPGQYVIARSEWILRQMGYGPRKPDPADEEPLEPTEQEVVPRTPPPQEEMASPAESPVEAPEANPGTDSLIESPVEDDEESQDGGTVTDEPLQETAPQSQESVPASELTL
jgi:monofunctional glycosyltransferase